MVWCDALLPEDALWSFVMHHCHFDGVCMLGENRAIEEVIYKVTVTSNEIQLLVYLWGWMVGVNLHNCMLLEVLDKYCKL